MNLLQEFNRCLDLNDQYIHVKKDASYYTEVKGDTLYIYFQWSKGKLDWFHNLNFPAKPYKRMKKIWFAHGGFFSVWNMVEPLLMPLITNPSIKKIKIVGYSHGAAIALLCYEYCMFHRPDAEIEGAGFGCPRVFWGFCSSSVRERFTNFIVVRNGDDLVTKVPPRCFGFRHISTIIGIGTPAEGSSGPIDDHSSASYIYALEDYYGLPHNDVENAV